jgi:isopenicillin-N N-acyltransferase like protein
VRRGPVMTRLFRSTATGPRARGIEFGCIHGDKIRANIAIYKGLFDSRAGGSFDATGAGGEALAATKSFAPDLHAEMLGMAEGAGVDPALIGMLNARTEVLALFGAGGRGECSVIIHVAHDAVPPVAVQTWDWFCVLRESWLVWEIPLADGSVTKTMTEYGIVGKSGMNTRGLGLLFTILHHVDDGKRIGVPVHVAARHALDAASNIARAAQMLACADVSASSSINLVSCEDGVSAAMSVELHPGGPGFVLPDARGFLIHTNHFLAPGLSGFDTAPRSSPDTLLRHDLLRRKMAALKEPGERAILSAMASHSGGDGAVCCHREPGADAASAYETLCTVSLDLARGELRVHAGGPCTHGSLGNEPRVAAGQAR